MAYAAVTLQLSRDPSTCSACFIPSLKFISTSALTGLEDFSVRYFKDFKLNFSEVLIYLDQSLMLKLNFSQGFITEKCFKCLIQPDLSIHTFFLPVIAFI